MQCNEIKFRFWLNITCNHFRRGKVSRNKTIPQLKKSDWFYCYIKLSPQKLISYIPFMCSKRVLTTYKTLWISEISFVNWKNSTYIISDSNSILDVKFNTTLRAFFITTNAYKVRDPNSVKVSHSVPIWVLMQVVIAEYKKKKEYIWVHIEW